MEIPLTGDLQELLISLNRPGERTGEQVYADNDFGVLLENIVKYNHDSVRVLHPAIGLTDLILEFLAQVEKGKCDGCKPLRELQKEGIPREPISEFGPAICSLRIIEPLQPNATVITTGTRDVRYRNKIITRATSEQNTHITNPVAVIYSVNRKKRGDTVVADRTYGACQIINMMSGDRTLINPNPDEIKTILDAEERKMQIAVDGEPQNWELIGRYLQGIIQAIKNS